jgi:hypothetical protein
MSNNDFSLSKYFSGLSEHGIASHPEIETQCGKYLTAPLCGVNPSCKWDSKKHPSCIENTTLANIEINEMNSEQLNQILLTRKRMLDVNLHKNDIKNKKLYTMFVFIIIIVLVMTIIHFKNSK